jgi:murein DD-endopeptidase MepM/ murein hydrolase activator NlpD
MTLHRKPFHSKPPRDSAPERLGLVSAIALSLISLGGVLAMLAGVVTMQVQTRAIEARGNLAVLSTQSTDLQHELSSLDRRLEVVWDQLLQAKALVGQARALDSRWKESPVAPSPADKDLAGTPLDETLREARDVSDCFEDMLAQMEANAGAWGGLPSILPVERVEVTSRFGLRIDPLNGQLGWHEGLDLGAPVGTPVHATARGVVVKAGYSGSYGLLVEIDHGNGLSTRYGHLSRLDVQLGDRVARDDLIGEVGATGRVSAPHLHYEIHVDGRPVNPEPYIMADLGIHESGASLAQIPSAPHHD